jgi:hypothetical protein
LVISEPFSVLQDLSDFDEAVGPSRFTGDDVVSVLLNDEAPNAAGDLHAVP